MSEEHAGGAKNTPEYCHYFKTLLVEELVLESDYRSLHYGQCAIIGRLRVAEHFRLENVRVQSLPEDCSLPEGALSLLLLGLTYDKASEQRVSNGCYCILRGEVVLCNVLRPNSPTLTTRGINEQLASLGHDSLARQKLLSDLKLSHKPALDVWFAQKIDATDELLCHRLEIRRLMFYTFSQFFADHCDCSACNWEAILQAAWQDFWQREGHELLELKWHKRFPEYKDLINVVTPEEQTLWQELWEKHAIDLSAKFWRILNCAFENYQNELEKSFGTSLEEVEQDFNELNITEKLRQSKEGKQDKHQEIDEDDESTKDDRDLDEDEQLKLLGLPTTFGTTYPKQHKQRQELHESSSSDCSDCSEELLIMESHKRNVLHGVQGGMIAKKKPQKKNLRTGMPEFMQNETKGQMVKYWLKRFSLFSRFDQGIRLDRESWFSVTPEKIAKQTARRLSCDLIVDAFCGCGGNAIQFANTCGRVIAVDIDADKLAMAKHNAGIYGVAHKIEFIHADFLQFAASSRIRPNVVFLSPPWGGPGYQKQANFDIERSLLPVGASELMKLARRLADTVGFFLPRNSSMNQVVALSGEGQQCEVEHNFLDTRLVALTAYYGNGVIRNQPPGADAAQ